MDKKATSIVTYVPFIGLALALVIGDKEGAKDHINQSITIHILWTIIKVIRQFFLIGFIAKPLGTLVYFLWLVWIISAIFEKDIKIPLLSDIKYLQ